MWQLIKTLSVNGARATSILITVAVGFYGLFLFVVGQPWTVVREGGGGVTVQWYSAPPALLIIAGDLVLLSGLLKRKLWITWIGFGFLLVFSMLFLFGIGGALIPLVSALLVFLILIQTQRALIAWVILIVLFAFSLFIRFDFAIPILFVTGLVLMLLTIAQRYASRVT